MRNKMKLGMCSALLVSSLVGGTLGTSDVVAHASSHVAQQVSNPFKDVSKRMLLMKPFYGQVKKELLVAIRMAHLSQMIKSQRLNLQKC